VDYTLTNLGYNLRPVIDSMVAWAEEYRETLLQELNQKVEEGKAKISESRAKLGNTIEQGRNKLNSVIANVTDVF
jgi:ribosome recycling factor